MGLDLGYLGDDTGDNISRLNDRWVELPELIRLYDAYYDALQHIEDDASRAYLREHRFSEVALMVMLHYDLHSRYGCPPLDEVNIRQYMDEN